MTRPPLRRCAPAAALCVLLLAAACATSSVLNVDYRLPPPAAGTVGRSVVVVFEDGRPNSDFLSPSARQELEGFADAFALTVSRPGKPGELRGAYALGPLFKEIVRLRLEDAGVKVVPAGAAADARFTLKLTDFRLDFGDRKWSASVGYEARLSRDGGVLSSQTVAGSAERVMLLKKADADKLVGELVSDAINQMDVAGIFKRAGL